MAARNNKVYYCEKCKKTMGEDQFYTSNNLEKFPDDGKLPQCKKCITMHVDNWDPATYLWILQDVDVPYIPDEWNKLMATYAKSGKMTGMTILGRYLSKMKLKQYCNYRWQDTEFLQELANKKIEETMKRQGYSAVEIADTLNKATFTLPKDLSEPKFPTEEEYKQFQATEDYFAQQSGAVEDDIAADLTEEDKKYLRLKWGKAYRADEWVLLEQLYNDMMDSYDIQSAGHIDILKKVCKTSLKTDQLLDIGDVEGAQKMSKMYDMLMKSGKFTAAQNKGESGEAVDSLSELFALCEQDGFIPRYYVDKPQDKVDRTLQDIQMYTKRLVEEETNLSTLIESAMKQIEIDKQKEAEMDADAANDDDLLEAELFAEDKNISDQDFSEYSEWEEEQEKEANELYKRLESGEL